MNAAANVVLPAAFVMTTSTVPAECAGALTLSDPAVPATTTPATPPKVTDVTPARLAPSMTMADPPAVPPLTGRIADIVGSAGADTATFGEYSELRRQRSLQLSTVAAAETLSARKPVMVRVKVA